MIDYVCYVQGVSNVFKGTGRPLSPHSEQFGKWEEFSCLLLFFFFPYITFANQFSKFLCCPPYMLLLEFNSRCPFTFIFAGAQLSQDREAFMCYYCNCWNELNSVGWWPIILGYRKSKLWKIFGEMLFSFSLRAIFGLSMTSSPTRL